MIRRLHQEEGYSLVVSMLLISIMMVLLVVALDAGIASLRQSNLSIEWSKSLTVAEAGVNDATTLLAQDRLASNPCEIGGLDVCTGGGGEYQVNWATQGRNIVITSIGYYPTMADPTFTRQVEATYAPIPSFRYAIFSQTALEVNNGMTVVGDIYSAGDITIGQNAEVCGSIISSSGGVVLTNSSKVVTDDAALGCTDKSGDVWTGGTNGITGASTVVVEGDLRASNPSTFTCSASGTDYDITMSGGTMTAGTATACGAIDASVNAGAVSAGTSSSQPVPVSFPTFTFDPNNYTSLTCYPTGGTCGSNDSDSAVQDFQTYVDANSTSLSGTFAVWQRDPTSADAISLDGITLSGDFTLITNAPIDFGNTSEITTTASSADLVVISTYEPTAACTADLVNTDDSDCSIYGKNAIEFDAGDLGDPDDGVVGLLYTTGKMAFVNASQNLADIGDGALYSESMDFKNGFNIIYNSRVERVLGFGTSYERILWQELNV
jgi:hypothetical protein